MTVMRSRGHSRVNSTNSRVADPLSSNDDTRAHTFDPRIDTNSLSSIVTSTTLPTGVHPKLLARQDENVKGSLPIGIPPHHRAVPTRAEVERTSVPRRIGTERE